MNKAACEVITKFMEDLREKAESISFLNPKDTEWIAGMEYILNEADNLAKEICKEDR